MELNKPLIEKMCVDMLANPESYDQGTPGQSYKSRVAEGNYGDSQIWPRPRPAPACGSVACLMGQAIISNAKTRSEGITEMNRVLRSGNIAKTAIKLTGLKESLFGVTSSGWPEPYKSEWSKAETYIDQTNAAVGMLRAIVKTEAK